MGMWPWASFRWQCDEIDFWYALTAGFLDGSTSQEASAVHFDFAGRGALGQGFLWAPGQEVVVQYDGLIDFPGGDAVLEIEAALDWDWVYQNTPMTTGDRHVSILTITLTSEPVPVETYDVTIEEDGGALTNFTTDPPQKVGNALVVKMRGGRAATTTANAPGSATLTVTVTGRMTGATDSETVDLQLRQLGDIDGSGAVSAIDRLYFNARLNGFPTPRPDRCYDLTGEGNVNLRDKVQLIKVMNGIPIP